MCGIDHTLTPNSGEKQRSESLDSRVSLFALQQKNNSIKRCQPLFAFLRYLGYLVIRQKAILYRIFKTLSVYALQNTSQL